MKKKSNPPAPKTRPPAPPGPPAPAPTHVIKLAPLGLDVPVWRKNPPTRAGLYWYSLRTTEELGEGVLRFCRVWNRDGVLVATAGNSFKPAAEFQRWWAGPLLEPDNE